MDHEAIAKRYRDQAEEFRVKSELMADQATRSRYEKIADSYDDLAENEERLVQAKRP